jgi:ATP-binding cassette subfamily F protein uup
VTLGVLEEALASFPGCAQVVSNDRGFLDPIATAILAFEGDGRVVLYEGNYSSWAEKAKSTSDGRPPPVAERKQTEPTATATPAPTPSARKLSYREKQELDGMVAAIGAAEARVGELQATLNDPSIYKARAAEVPGLVAALDAARAEVERLYARWQELESLR